MAWTATEDFESYTIGNNFAGGTGGSNWTGAWTDRGGSTWTVETGPTGAEGTKSARCIATSNNTNYSRDYTAISEGSASWQMRLSTTTPNADQGVFLGTTVSGKMFVRFGSTGNIEMYDGDLVGWASIQAYSADTWYRIDVEFDAAGQPNKYRVRVDSGTWTAWTTVYGSTYETVERLTMENSSTNAHTFWVDDIRATTAGSAGSSVTWVGYIG